MRGLKQTISQRNGSYARFVVVEDMENAGSVGMGRATTQA